MDDQSPRCRMIQRTVMPSLQITCCCSGQELVYLLGCLLREIIILAVDGDRCSTSWMCFGDGGLENISLHYKRDRSGVLSGGISQLTISCLYLTILFLAAAGLLNEYLKFIAVRKTGLLEASRSRRRHRH